MTSATEPSSPGTSSAEAGAPSAADATQGSRALPLRQVGTLVAAAIVFAYPVWQAIAFTIDPRDYGWYVAFEIAPWARVLLAVIGIGVPILGLAAGWLLTRGRAVWARLVTLATAWVLVTPVVLSVQYLVFTPVIQGVTG